MRRRFTFLGVAAVVGGLGAIAAAQGPGRIGANWPTVGADAQRTFWMRNETGVSSRGAWSPQFKLLWKTKLDNQPAQLNALTQPLLLENIISHKGFKALAFVGGSSDNVYAIDYELNKIYWKRHLDTAVAAQNASPTCPGGLMAVTRAATVQPPPVLRAVGRSQTAPPPSLIGGPLPGSATPNNAPITDGIYAISSGGMLHALNPHIGDDIVPPVKFLPPNAKVVGSIVIDFVLYAATTDKCGGAPNALWAVDLANASRPIVKWETGGNNIAGSTGLAVGTNGVIYTTTDASGGGEGAGSVVGLEAPGLTPKDRFTVEKSGFVTSPLTFNHKDRDLVIAGNRDGRLYVLDGTALGGSDHATPLSKTTPFSNAVTGSLATWEDSDGTRWVLAAANGPIQSDTSFAMTNGAVSKGSVVAFKLVDRNGVPTLEPAWASRDVAAPLAPMVMNDVVFAVASGLEPAGTGQTNAKELVSRAKPAVVYALDARTGKELWNSGSTITSFATAVPPSGGDSQVYVVTYDGTLYTFGLPVER